MACVQTHHDNVQDKRADKSNSLEVCGTLYLCLAIQIGTHSQQEESANWLLLESSGLTTRLGQVMDYFECACQ